MEPQVRLDPQRVEAVFMDSLFREGEDTGNHVKAEGISVMVGFHPERLESHRAEIEAMLDELPDDFKESGGGGESFLDACKDKHGNQWTGFQERIDQLFMLGTAIDKVKLALPRDMWGVLPGGMPYYVISS